jgi:hypothetical protein
LTPALNEGKWFSFTLLPHYHHGNSLRYLLDRKLGGARAGLDDLEKKESLDLQGIKPPNVQPKPVPIPTELSRPSFFPSSSLSSLFVFCSVSYLVLFIGFIF